MKRLLTIISALFIFPMMASAQLNTEAEVLREEQPEQYNNIKCYAVNKWGDDNQMIVHTINKQAEALVVVLRAKDEELVSDDFLAAAMNKWEYDECEGYNWRMVVHEIKNQIENSDY